MDMDPDGGKMQMNCSNCGEEIEADWVKCPMCNAKIETNIAQGQLAGPQVRYQPGAPPAQPAPQPPRSEPMAEASPSPNMAIQGLETTQEPSMPQGTKAGSLSISGASDPLAPEQMPTPQDDPILNKDLQSSEKARNISEAAASSSKSIQEIKELKALVEQKEKTISELQETITHQLKELESSAGGAEDLKKRENDLAERSKVIDQKEAQLASFEENKKAFEENKKGFEEERERVKAQAASLTQIQSKIETKRAQMAELERSLEAAKAQIEERQVELDTMIDQYGDKITKLKGREDKLTKDEIGHGELESKLYARKAELDKLEASMEKEKADIKERSRSLFEKIEKVEERAKEMDKRDKVILANERRNSRWEEDLRHTEIHLLSIQKEIDDCVYCSVKDRFMTVDKLIAEAKSLGAEVDIAEQDVKRAKILLDEGEFEKAVEKAKGAIRMVEQAKRQYYSYGVKYTIKAVEKIINSIKELGVSTDEPEALLNDAKEALGEEDYERSEDYAKMAERIALHMEEKAEDISTLVKRLEGLISQATSEGQDISLANDLLTEAKALAKDGDYGSSIETLKEAEETLKAPLADQAQIGGTGGIYSPTEQPEQQYKQPGPMVTIGQGPSDAQYPAGNDGTDAALSQDQGTSYQYETRPEVEPTIEPGPPASQAIAPPGPTPAARSPSGSRFKCPYCFNIFEVRNPSRPMNATCPYCKAKVMIN